MTDIVPRLWGFCHTLRHEGIDYGDYIEQITYLLFLKMAHEKGLELPAGCSWDALKEKSGTELTDHYIELLRTLGKQEGLLGDVFAGALSRFHNPVSLKKLISLIDETEWTTLDIDVKAAAFEGLLEKAASEGKKGAGQYFTPRILIKSIVRCMKPDPRRFREFTIMDPACGTGGFLICSYDWLKEQTGGGAFDRDFALRIRHHTYFGKDLVERPRRLALMNLFLHGLDPEIKLGDSIYEVPDSRRYEVVMTNPPFGTRGANQSPGREDFLIETSNKQLNFIQHVMTILKPGGRAAVVVPDNVLFADQAGAVFEDLTKQCALHTVLRLPNGTFSPYSPGTKTNVIFFTKGMPTETIWVYDGRTNVSSITKKDRPLTSAHFDEFEACYGPDPNGRASRDEQQSKTDRWRSFHITELQQRDFKIDSLKWLRDEGFGDSDEMISPEDFATEAIKELEAAIEDLNTIVEMLGNGYGVNQAEQHFKLPESWIWTTAKSVCASVRDGTHDTPKYIPEGVPLVTSKNLSQTGLDFTRCKNISLSDHKSICVRSKVDKGDVLFAMIGTIGNAVVVTTDNEFSIKNVGLFKKNDSVINSDYLRFWLTSSSFKELLNRKELIKGTTQPFIPLRNLRILPIPLAPLAEQDRIVAKIEALFALADHVDERVAAAKERADRLTQAILVKAFQGGLVPTEAELAKREGRNYEPASVLLKHREEK